MKPSVILPSALLNQAVTAWITSSRVAPAGGRIRDSRVFSAPSFRAATEAGRVAMGSPADQRGWTAVARAVTKVMASMVVACASPPETEAVRGWL